MIAQCANDFTLFHLYGNTPGNLVTNNGREDEVNMNIKKDSGFKVFKENHLGKYFQEEQNAFNTFCSISRIQPCVLTKLGFLHVQT